MTWDLTTPDGTEALSNGDNRIRELKTDIQTAMRGNASDGIEAKFPGSDTASPVFRYRGIKGTTAARPVSGQYGLYVDTTRNVLQRDNGSSWEDIATLIPATTVMVFYQATAPVGWTKLTTQNDKALRVVSGSSGGSAGGSLGLSTGITLAHTHTVDSHTHDLANHTHSTPAHQHTLDATLISGSVPPSLVDINKIVSVSPSLGGSFTADALYYNSDATGAYTAAPGYTTSQYNKQTVSGGSGTSGAPSSNTSSAATPATDSQLTNVTLAYADVILCSKD